MKLATIHTLDGATRAVRVDDEHMVDLGAADLGEFLAAPGWQQRAAAARECVEGPGPDGPGPYRVRLGGAVDALCRGD